MYSILILSIILLIKASSHFTRQWLFYLMTEKLAILIGISRWVAS